MKETKSKQPTSYKKYVLLFWSIFILGIAAVITLFWAISKGYLGYIPPIQEIESPKNKYETQLISSDNVVLGSIYFQGENRTKINYNDLSPYLVNALISTEDIRFAKHSGIDAKGILRAVTGVVTGRNSGGGSTITQQLAKQLYTENAYNVSFIKRIFQKLNEYVIAVQLERFYTKEEILTMYLNKFDFNNNATGIQTAARVYFNTTPKDLKIEEAAMLVGMLQNPTLYNPKRFPEKTQKRRNIVLGQLKNADYISTEEFDSLKTLPIVLDYHKVDHKVGPIPYFREFIRQFMTAEKPLKKNYRGWDIRSGKYLADSISWATNPLYGWCNKNFKPDGSNYSLYTDGLKIFTTIDSRMQKYAQQAMYKHLSEDVQPKFFKQEANSPYAPYSGKIGSSDKERIERMHEFLERAMQNTDRYRRLTAAGVKRDSILKIFNTPVSTTVFSWNGDIDTVMSPMDSIRYMKYYLRSGMMSMNPLNGHVKVYVGGIDYSYFQYDMVSLGHRQVGSTIKPFLYTLAMQEGYTPCSRFLNAPITIYDDLGRPWTPDNSDDDRLNEMVTLKWGLAKSNNFISARLMNEFKPKTLADLIHSMGITSSIDAVPSMCLGTPDFSVKEMVKAYGVFANHGVMTDPVFVTRIEDKDGNIIATFSPYKKEVIHENTAYLMLNLLQGVVDTPGGTGGRLRFKYHFRGPIGGKTGTTQDQSDGWFMGVLPNLVTGVWVGGEERSIRFNNITNGQGAEMALPIFALYLKSVYADSTLGYDPMEDFEKPAGFNTELDCDKFTVPAQDETGTKSESPDNFW
ncbi:transglycosylase domain-containing protein [Saccharicrinis sp. FJH54]|uniref:transglycosylase domain-containing protein n=1 Tax=Saccharicrinis sp. FJH54 TaxID=3344665 RepID=UPI0035D41D7B